METVQVTEGGRLLLPGIFVKRGYLERIIRAGQHFRFDVFTVDSRGVRVGNVVGLLDLGTVRVEILPKASATSSASDDQLFLLRLLAEAGLIPRARVSRGHVRQANGRAVEVLILFFAQRLFGKLTNGLPRRYSPEELLSPVLRGRIDFSSLARQIPGRDHLLPIRHSPLQPNNPLARLVRAVVDELLILARSNRTRETLRACSRMLEEVPSVPLTARVVGSVRLSPLEKQWEDEVEMATALAQGRIHDPTSAGGSSFFSLLFSLEDLFERILRRKLTGALSETGIELVTRPRRLHLLHSMTTGNRSLALNPDYLFVRRDNSATRVLVADAKWKRLISNAGSFGLKPSDVYQLSTYMASYGLTNGILFFPRVEWMPEEWSHTFRLIGRESTIRLVAVDMPGLVSPDSHTQRQAIGYLRSTVMHSVDSLGGAGSARNTSPR